MRVGGAIIERRFVSILAITSGGYRGAEWQEDFEVELIDAEMHTRSLGYESVL